MDKKMKKNKLVEFLSFFLVSLILVILLYLLWWVMGYGYFKGINGVGVMDVVILPMIFLVLYLVKKYAKKFNWPYNLIWSLVLGFLFVFWFEINIVNYFYFTFFCLLVVEILKMRLFWAVGLCFGFLFWMRVLDFVLWNDQLVVTLIAPGPKMIGALMFLIVFKIVKKYEIV